MPDQACPTARTEMSGAPPTVPSRETLRAAVVKEAGRTPDDVTHYPELDGIRGIAILLVLLSHSVDFLGVVPNRPTVPGYSLWGQLALRIFLPGWGGVDVFFTLSGFLITGILLRARGRSNYFSSFYARRALRILPLYYGFLFATLLLAHVSHSYWEMVPHSSVALLSYFLYVQNWPLFWNSWASMGGGSWGVFWSLAVEEQFYMVWPTLVRFVKLRWLLEVCAVGTFLGMVIRFMLMSRHGLQFGIMQAPISRLDGLFVGAAIALYREVIGRPIPMRWAKLWVVSGFGVLLSIAFFRFEEFEGSGVLIWTFGPFAFSLIAGGLIAASHYKPRSLHSILSSKPLLMAGRLSYGMYVYHVLIFWALNTYVKPNLMIPTRPIFAIPFAALYIMLAILLVTGVANLSFRYFETPFLRLKKQFPSPAAPV